MIDWTQEYIEIYYSWSDVYDWQLEITWVKSKAIQYEIIIQPQSYLVIWDSLQQLSKTLCQTFHDAKLSLTDSRWVDIEIIRSDWSSSAHIDVSLVTSIDNQKRSFILQQNEFFAIEDSSVKNTTVWWYWSPCLDDKKWVWEDDTWETVWTWNSTVLVWSWWSVWSWTGSIENWSWVIIWVGDTDVLLDQWTLLPDDSCGTPEDPADVVSSIPPDSLAWPSCKEYILQPWDITIYWVSPTNGKLSDEFLILESIVGYSWSLFIQWWWRWSVGADINVSLIPGTKYFVVKNERWFTTSIPSSIFSSLSLTDKWESLSLISNEGVIIDEIYRSWSRKDQILFSSTSTTSTSRQLSAYWTLPYAFSSLSWVSCDLQLSDGGISLQDISICSVPWVSTWKIWDQISTSCELWIMYDTTQLALVVFTKSIADTVLCESSLEIVPKLPWISLIDSTVWGSWNTSSYTWTAQLYTSWAIIISEISPKDSLFPEYIELILQEWVEWTFEIQWLWQWAGSKEITIWSHTPRIVIVTNDLIPSLPTTSQIIISSISLSDKWEFLEVRHWWQIIDSLLYSEWIQQKTSWLRTSEWGSWSFILAPQTPWFTISMIEHLLPPKWEEQFNCAIRPQNTSPFTFENKLNLVASVSNKDITNSSKQYTCMRTWWDLWTSSWSEELWKCNPWFLSFPSSGIYEIQLRMKSNTWKVCTTSTSINAPAKDISEIGLESIDSKNSYYQKLYHTWKWRFELLKTNIKPYGLKTNSSWSIVTSTQQWIFNELNTLDQPYILSGIVSIQRLLPNPSGKDADAEQMVLYNHTNSNLDTTWRHIDTWKKKILFPQVTLKLWVETIVTWTLWLVNSDRCVSILWPTDEIYDIFCYGKANDDEWFDVSNEWILSMQTINSQWWLVLQDMKIMFEEDEVCLMYEWSWVRCKSLPVWIDELKQLKSDSKKVDSTQKRYNKERIRRKKYQNQIKDEKKKLTTYKKSANKKLLVQKNKSKKYRNDISFQKRLNSVHRWLIQLWYWTLQSDFKPLYVWSPLATQWLTYRSSLDAVYSSNTNIQYWPVLFDVTHVDVIHAYLQWRSLVVKTNVPSQRSVEIIKWIWEWFHSDWLISSNTICQRPDLYSFVSHK